MRAFGYEVRRFGLVDVPPTGSAGVDGDSPFADIQAGGFDLTPEMSGTRKWRTIEEMRKTDSMIRSILFMYKLPIRAASWNLNEADDDPDQRIRDATAKQFGLANHEGRLDLTWGEWLNQTMLFMDFGCMGEEVVWADGIELWDIGPSDDGTPRPPLLIRPIARMAPRFPATVDQIKTDKATGKIISIRQGFIGNGLSIPGAVEKLAWYVHEREGTNWWGTPLLRSMYGPWRLKKALMIAAAIGWDRFASGVPVVRYPKGAGARAKLEAEQAARNYRTHERAWITFEGTEQEGWKLDIVGGASTLADPTPLITLYNEEMATGALQIFSRLGSGAQRSGSRALGQVLADPYYIAVTSYANDLAKTRMRTAFRAFVDVNFGTEFKTPILTASKIQSKNILALAQAMYYLAQAGYNFTDRETQNDIRDQLDLRHLPEPVAQLVADLPDDVGIEDPSAADDAFDVPPPGVASAAALAAGFVAREGDGLGH